MRFIVVVSRQLRRVWCAIVVYVVGIRRTERLDHRRNDGVCVASLVVAIILVPLYGWPAHIARIAGLVRELASDREDLVLHPRDPQLVLVLHTAKARLEIANISPKVCLAVLSTSGENVTHTTARRAAVTGETSSIGAGLWRYVLLVQRTRSWSGI